LRTALTPEAIKPEAVRQTKAMKEPTNQEFAAYQRWKVEGKDQTTIAKELESELRISVGQSKASRWCTHVEKWLSKGNQLPPPRRITVDPHLLDQGRRRDGRR
jgi:hypothetical protein